MKDATIKDYRGYIPLIQYSEEDGCFIGVVAGLNRHSITFEGESEEEARKDFERAIDFYLETTPNPEKPFSGRITIDVSLELHAELARRAHKDGEMHLNAWLAGELKTVLHG